jgi:hypothetical protein
MAMIAALRRETFPRGVDDNLKDRTIVRQKQESRDT